MYIYEFYICMYIHIQILHHVTCSCVMVQGRGANVHVRYTATPGNTRQHTATHCNTLKHTATHCSTRQHTVTHCHTLQHTATHGNTRQHTATHSSTLQHTATHCNTLPTHCNTFNPLQHAATYCRALVVSKVVLPIVFDLFWRQIRFFTNGGYGAHHKSALAEAEARRNDPHVTTAKVSCSVGQCVVCCSVLQWQSSSFVFYFFIFDSHFGVHL